MTDYKIKEFTNAKLKRARKDNSSLKKENMEFEEENERLRNKLQDFQGMDVYYLNEIEKLQIALNRYQIKEGHLLKNNDVINDLQQE